MGISDKKTCATSSGPFKEEAGSEILLKGWLLESFHIHGRLHRISLGCLPTRTTLHNLPSLPLYVDIYATVKEKAELHKDGFQMLPIAALRMHTNRSQIRTHHTLIKYVWLPPHNAVDST